MFNLVFLPKGLIAPLILLAERNSRVWLISNQGVWTSFSLGPVFLLPVHQGPWTDMHSFPDTGVSTLRQFLRKLCRH